jgi:HPt (histidine-containing phosphotransfer) domain-containing protein
MEPPRGPSEHPSPAASPDFDELAFRQLYNDLGEVPEVMRDLVETYLQEGPTILTRLQDSAAADRREDVANAAHSLKSPSRSLGVLRVADLCEAVEHLARAGSNPSPETVRHIVLAYGAGTQRLAEALDRLEHEGGTR